MMAVWTGLADGTTWSLGGNWSTGIAPGMGGGDNLAEFTGNAPGNISVNGNFNITGLEFKSIAAAYTLNGGTLNITSGPLTQNVPSSNVLNILLNGTNVVGNISAGTLNLNNAFDTFNAASTLNVTSGGTLIAAVSAGNRAIGDAAISLNNGNLTLNAIDATVQDGARFNIYDTSAQDPRTEAGMATLLNATLGARDMTKVINKRIHYQDDNAFNAESGIDYINVDGSTFTTIIRSEFTPTVSGTYIFDHAHSDDDQAFWVDKDRDGVFETGGGATQGSELIFSRGCCAGGQGSWNGFVAGTTYLIGIAVRDTGGGGDLQDVNIQGPAGSGFTTLTDLDTSVAPLAGLFKVQATTAPAATGHNNNFSVSGNSTLNIGRLPSVDFGNLNVASGATFNVAAQGVTGGTANFNGTTNLSSSATFNTASTTLKVNSIAGSSSVVKQGSGTLQFASTSVPFTAANTITVQDGRLLAAVNGPSTAIGTANMVFTGGELEFLGATSSIPNAISHYGYHVNNDNVVMNLNNNAGMMNGNPPNPTAFANFFGFELLTSGPVGQGLRFTNDNDFIGTGAIGQADNYSNLFLMTLTVTPAQVGTWQFRINQQDDPTGIWVDLNQDGIFQSFGALSSNANEQLSWNETGAKSVFLNAGNYLVAYTHREGGGGSVIDARVRSPLMGAEEIVNPTAASQAGFWTATAVAPITLTNSFQFQGNATIDTGNVNGITITGNATFGTAGTPVTVTTETKSKELIFTDPDLLNNTTFNTLGSGNLVLQNLSDNAGVFNVTKTGTGRLDLNTFNSVDGQFSLNAGTTVISATGAFGPNATGTSVADGATLRVADGFNFADNEPLSLDGTLLGNAGTSTYGGPITTTGNGGILQATGGATLVISNTVTVTQPLTVQGDGTVDVDGMVTGGAAITKAGNGTFRLDNNGNNFTGAISITDGVVLASQPNSLGSTAGRTQVVSGGTLELSGTFALAAEPIQVAGTGENGTQGALRSSGGNQTLTSPIDIYASATITSATAGSGMTIGGPITMHPFANVTFDGVGNTTMNSAFGNGTASTQVNNAINHYGYHDATDVDTRMDLNNNAVGSLINGGSPTTGPGYFGQSILTWGPGLRGTDFNDDNDFLNTGAIGRADNYSNLFLMVLHVTAGNAGTWGFRNAGDDDRAGIWLDIDRDGIFESTTAGLGSNRGEQLSWEDGGNKTVSLVAGDYLVAFTHREQGGGSVARFRYTAPGGSEQSIRPADPAQAGLWSTANAITPNNNVIKNGTGTLTLAAANTYSGTTTVNTGTLVVANANALSNNTAGTIVRNGGTLGIAAGLSFAGEPIQLNGNGATGQPAALVNIGGGASSFTGAITAEDASRGNFSIGSDGGTLTLNGTIDERYSQLTFNGTGSVVVNSVISGLNATNQQNGLQHYGYHINNDGAAMNLNNNGGMVNGTPPNPAGFTSFVGTSTLTNGPVNQGLRFTQDSDFISTGNIGQADNYSNLFLGILRVTAANAGTWNFRINQQDDPTGIWLDINQDGIFQSNGALNSNQNEQLSWNETGNKTAFLNPGDYMIAFTHREGGGGSVIDARFRSPTMGAEAIVNPSDPTQNGIWLTTFVSNNAVVKNGTGTVTLAGANTYVGSTTVNNGLLTVQNAGALGGAATGTTVNAGGTLGIAPGIHLNGEPLTLAGNGASGQPGALVNTGGASIYTGTITGTASPFGSVVALGSNGGTLTVNGTVNLVTAQLVGNGTGNVIVNSDVSGVAGPVSTPGILERIFNGSGLNVQGDIQALRTATLGAADAQGILTGHINYPNDASVSTRAAALGAVGFDNGDYSQLWVTTFTPDETGNWNFRVNGSDDEISFWIDTTGTVGIFDATSDRIGNRGCCAAMTSSTPFLIAGTPYLLGIAMKDTGGGGNFTDMEFSRPSASGTWLNLDPSTAPASMFTVSVSSNNQVIKNGTGTMTLAGNNSYSGLTIINAGTLIASTNTNALGTTGAGTTVMPGGAALGLAGNVVLANETISVVPNATPGIESVVNVSGNNTITGNIVDSVQSPGGHIGIRSDAGLLTIQGNIDIRGENLNFAGAGNTTVSGQIIGNVGVVTNYSQEVLATSGLGSYYQLNETSGTTANDTGPAPGPDNGTMGTGIGLNQASAFATLGTAVSFDGTGNGIITLPNANTLGFTNANFTAMAWINTNNVAANQAIFGTNATGATDFGLHLDIRNQRLMMGFYGDDIDNGANTPLLSNTWYHVVWTYNAGTNLQTMYVNGAQYGGTRTAVGDFQGTDVVRLGQSCCNGNFNGRMDEAAIFNRDLSAAEISNLYNKGGFAGSTSPVNLSKSGTGTLVLANTNTYTGTTTVNGGIMRPALFGAITSNVTVTSGGTFDTNGLLWHNVPRDFTIAGPGTAGQPGAIINSASAEGSVRNLTMSGSASIGTNAGKLNVYGSIAGAGNTLTINGTGETNFRTVNSIGNIAGISVNTTGGGRLRLEADQAPATPLTITVNANGRLDAWATRNFGTNLTVGLNGGILESNGGGTATFNGPITVAGTSSIVTNNRIDFFGSVSGAGTLTKTGTDVFNVRGGVASLGGLNINNGRVRFENTGFGAWTGPITVNTNGILSPWGTMSTAANLVLNGGTIADENGGVATYNGNVSVTGPSFISTVGGNVVLNGAFSGTGGFTKQAAGIATFNGNSPSYSGTMTIQAGSAVVNGLLGGSVIVPSGSILTGDGAVGPLTVQSGGNFTPGNTLNDFGTGNLALQAGANLNVQINGLTPVTQYDQVITTGTVNVTGANLLATLGFVPPTHATIVLVRNDGVDPVVGKFANASTELATINIGGFNFLVSYTYNAEGGTFGNGNDIALIRNTLPTAIAGSYSISEGDDLVLDGSASSDADFDSLSFRWDVDGDGDFDENITGVNPTVTWATLQSLGIDDGLNPAVPRTIYLEVNDGAGGIVVSTGTLNFELNNSPPTAFVTGPSASGPGQTLSFTFSATDPSDTDTAADFTYDIDWDGDSIPDEQVTGPGSGVTLTHSFPTVGTITISVTATDDDGGVSAPATHVLEISPVFQDSSGNVFVAGLDGYDDRIVFSVGQNGRVMVRWENSISRSGGAPLNYGPFTMPVGARLIATGGGGADTMTSSVPNIPVSFDGGAGNDYLAGGNAADSLLGGDGDDRILGGIGNDYIDCGIGNDSVDGGADNDTILGGAGIDTLNGSAGNDVMDGGDDKDTMNGGAGMDVMFGGNGNDTVNGAGEGDVILGGAGDDTLLGDVGRDILLGGNGKDTLTGGNDDDVVGGGLSSYDNYSAANAAALKAILAEWNSGNVYNTRVANLKAGTGLAAGNRLNPVAPGVVTATNDSFADTVNGGAGTDWFLHSASDINDRAAATEKLN